MELMMTVIKKNTNAHQAIYSHVNTGDTPVLIHIRHAGAVKSVPMIIILVKQNALKWMMLLKQD
jgi:hypothetical protein